MNLTMTQHVFQQSIIESRNRSYRIVGSLRSSVVAMHQERNEEYASYKFESEHSLVDLFKNACRFARLQCEGAKKIGEVLRSYANSVGAEIINRIFERYQIDLSAFYTGETNIYGVVQSGGRYRGSATRMTIRSIFSNMKKASDEIKLYRGRTYIKVATELLTPPREINTIETLDKFTSVVSIGGVIYRGSQRILLELGQR